MMVRRVMWQLVLAIGALVSACKKDTTTQPAGDSDAALFAEATASGYGWYRGTPAPTPSRNNGAHGYERVRFNAIAQAALDTTGKLPVGAMMPVGAVIVKEEYASATGPLVQYAVMKKTGAASGSGYEWAKYSLDGRAVISVGDQGAACVTCHAGSTNRDLVRSFDLN